jgi:AraC-like DNA-binding protein
MLLSRNYPPSPVLADVVARHYVFAAEMPDGFTLVDRLLSETAFIRVLIKGDWAGEVAPGEWLRPGNVLFFGPNTRPLRVRVRGAFHVVGVALRPCGWRALFDRPASDYADRMLRLGEVWGAAAEPVFADVARRDDDAAIIAACEAAIAGRLRPVEISPAMRAFERIARNDSTMHIEDAAERVGLSTRQFERQVEAHFGASPKTVLRRSRFLDMATVIRGLGDPTDEHLAALRFFDQSHKTREFKRFIGMTPAEFERTPTPLLTAGLKLRAERRDIRTDS